MSGTWGQMRISQRRNSPPESLNRIRMLSHGRYMPSMDDNTAQWARGWMLRIRLLLCVECAAMFPRYRKTAASARAYGCARLRMGLCCGCGGEEWSFVMVMSSHPAPSGMVTCCCKVHR